MMKRVLSLFVALSLMLCVFNVGYVFAEGEDSALTEVIDEQITEEQPEPTAEEALPTSTPEFTDEPVGEDENENIEDENVGDANADDASYEVVQVPTGEYAAINIAARDLEVYVTDGTNPISGAAVTVGGQTVISDANGYAVFSDIPTADTHYDLIVNCEYGQKTESILLPKTEVMDSATADVPIANATVSYWQPDIEEEDGVSALSATALYYEEWYSVVSRVDDPKFIDEYNGKIYVYGDNFRVYNPDGETWTDLTDLYGGDEMIRCGDSFYLYSASWSADGDYYWDASYSLYRYNISNNSWTTVDTGSGGMFDPAVTVCGDKIYFSGGYQVIYDMDVKETRYDVSYFDTSDNSWSQYYNVLSGGGDIIAVLCEESGDYYNDIFYIDDSYVIRFDTETDTFTTIGYINRSYSLCYDAVYKNGSIYLVGRTSNEEYDIVQYNVAASGWSTLVTLSAAETFTMIEYNNKLFISGSDTDETVFYTYDMLTGNIKYQYLHYAILSHCAVEYDGKIYLVANNGTLAVHDALLSNIFISPDLTLAVDGIAHSVYVKNGDVYTRGDNTYGQLGYGNNNSSETFIKVNGNWDDKMIVKVAAGADTTFALTEDNTLYGWGRNDKYQLGVGNNININTPVQIMTDVADVSAGYEHTLVLKTNGDVYGFGDNTYGQLASDGTSIHTPVKVYSNAVSIGTGDYHSLVIDNLNSLYTTGKNDNGQLGIGNTDNQNNFNLAMSNVKKAAGGYNHTVALDIVGNVYTCGDNRSLQLGRTVSSYSNSFALTDTATDVWAGANSTAYLKNGKLYQCGSGVYPTEGYFAPINGVDNPQSVSIGKNCYAVLGNGTLYRWGVFSETDEVLNPTWKLMLTPQKLNCYYKYKDVDSYRTQTLAIDENNEVWAWGEGYYGDGTDKMVTHYSPVHIDGLENIIQISRGKNHNLALDSSGNVWAWGSNSNYPMGSGLGGKVKRPTVIMSNVKQISAGTEYSVFLKNDGTIWGVGKNDEKQLCDSSETYYSTPIKLSDKSDFVFISSDDTASAAIDANGTVYAWGSDQAITQITADFTDGESTKFTEVSVGEYHYLALTDAGYVYSWGKNYYGQLGVGDKVKRDAPTIVRVSSSNAPLTNVRSVYAGARQSLAITNDGKIYGFGSGACYQLAMSNRGTIRYATLISALQNKNIVKAGTGYNFSVALDADGNIYTFGDGESGALGIYQNDASVDGEINEDYLWLKQQMNAVSQPITSSITLPSTAPNGSSITWISSNTYYIADDGTLVNRPDCYGSDTDVKLTATITNGAETVTGKYTITVKQDPAIKPSTDIPIRSIGFEYDQIYPNNDSSVAAPEINAVTVKIIDEQNGKYRLSVKDDQYNVDDNSTNPFFFWSAREGTFLPDNTCSDYSSVYFTVDESALNKKVKVIVGVGDGLGYVDKKAIILQGEAVEVETQEAALSENAVALAVEQELSSIDASQVQGLNLAIGIDMSKDMIEFDAGGAKTWSSVIEGLIDSAPEDTTFDIYTSLNFRGDILGKTAAHTGLEEVVSDEYGGTETALALVENTVQMLDQNNSGSNSAVIFVKGIEDAEEVETKIAELEQNGTAVYVMVLGGGYEGNNENIINCLNELELRLNTSRLYEAFSNVSAIRNGSVALLSADGAVTLAVNDYVSDFKTGKHKFNVSNSENNFGKAIASLLNLYGCLPAIASKTDGNQNSYDLFDNTSNVYQLVMNNAYEISVNDSVTKMFKFYEEMKDTFETDSNIAIDSSVKDAKDTISKNLKYRFPVVITNGSNTKIVVGKSGNSYDVVEYTGNGLVEGTLSDNDDTNYSIIDTYLYLLQISNGTAINDDVSGEGNFYSKISFNVPSGFTISNGIKFVGYGETKIDSSKISVSDKMFTISGIKTGDEYLAGIKTVYNGAIPQIYNSTKYYLVKQYADEPTFDRWYASYLFKATNLGIIGGDENLNFNAENAVTRAEMFKMILEAAKIDVDNNDSDATYWARGYIKYMQDCISEYSSKHEDNGYFYEEMPREEVANVIYTIFINKVGSINVPSNVYNIPKGTSCVQNTNWINKTAFNDFNSVTQSPYQEGIRQMYYNGIMSGSLESDGGIYFKPKNSITRSEACKVIIMCLFDITESVEKVNIVMEDEKTVYIMLYDSEVAKYSTETSGTSRYRDSDDKSYQYSVDFFENYLSMIGDKKVAFVISIRDVDFDTTTSGYQTTVGDSEGSEIIPAHEITQTRMNNIINKTVSKSVNIINNIKTALSNVNEDRTDKLKMPDIYIGTPHTNTNNDWIAEWIRQGSGDNIESVFLEKYQYVAESIYNNAANFVGEGTITGMYFGRENPDDMYNTYNQPTVSYKNASNISDFIHSKGKKLLWIPFSTSAQEWENVGLYVNQGKSCNNDRSDLFDIVMMQPGIFYSKYSGTKTDIDNYDVGINKTNSGYSDQKRKIKDLYTIAKNNCFYMYGQPVGASKTTNTLISFEIEYDISLVTGRVHYDEKMKPTDKANNFTITYNYYQNLIYDDSTSYAIYAGGPNEQNYDSLNETRNNNVHCFINHPSYFGSEYNGNPSDDGDGKAYSQFYDLIQKETGNNGYYAKDYNNLIYDITKGLLYGEDSFGSECKEYLGWN